MSSEYYNNKVIWITGASSGIGESLVYQLEKYNTKLIISSRKKQDLEMVRLKCHNSDNIFVLPLDLGELETIEEKAKEAIEKFGKIDIIINNAGIGQRSLAKDSGIEIDKNIMNVNYFGTVALTKAILPDMLARKSGQIIVISSLVGKYGTPFRSAYVASKHALHGFFDSLRAEIHKDNIRVGIICPGIIKTEISAKAITGDGKAYGKMPVIPPGFGLSPQKCAAQIIRAIEKQKEEVLVGGPEKYSVHIKRLFPNLFSRVIRSIRVI